MCRVLFVVLGWIALTIASVFAVCFGIGAVKGYRTNKKKLAARHPKKTDPADIHTVLAWMLNDPSLSKREKARIAQMLERVSAHDYPRSRR